MPCIRPAASDDEPDNAQDNEHSAVEEDGAAACNESAQSSRPQHQPPRRSKRRAAARAESRISRIHTWEGMSERSAAFRAVAQKIDREIEEEQQRRSKRKRFSRIRGPAHHNLHNSEEEGEDSDDGHACVSSVHHQDRHKEEQRGDQEKEQEEQATKEHEREDEMGEDDDGADSRGNGSIYDDDEYDSEDEESNLSFVTRDDERGSLDWSSEDRSYSPGLTSSVDEESDSAGDPDLEPGTDANYPEAVFDDSRDGESSLDSPPPAHQQNPALNVDENDVIWISDDSDNG